MINVNRGKNRLEKTRDLFKKIRDTKGTFHTSSVQSLSHGQLPSMFSFPGKARGKISPIWSLFFFDLLFLVTQFSSVAQSCPTLCDPMNCSSPGFPVHHQLLELAQTHVHQIGDAILCCPLLLPSIFTSIRVSSK